MTEQAINTAIAEACGFTGCKIVTDCRFEIPVSAAKGFDANGDWVRVPNYTGDLNAMHEAGLWMESNATSKCDIYATQLSYVINPKNGQVGDFRYIHATALQRAEAFLRACGKWVEE